MKLLKLLTASVVLSMVLASSAQAHRSHESRHAVTLWWVIFNQPENCISHPDAVERCGLADSLGQPYLDSVAAGAPDPSLIAPNMASAVAVLYATGGITSRRGYVRLAASIYRSAEEGLDLAGTQVVDPLGLGSAFSNPGAEVHLVVRDHGARDREGQLLQIKNYLEPYCSDPALKVEGGDNICKDVQFAVFGPGEAGNDSLMTLADGKLLPYASAYLFRQGDMLQAVVETTVRNDRRGH